MPIYCVCPNGHRLLVHERYAGAKTRCVKCREPLHIPLPEDGQLTDTGILKLLGDFEPVASSPPATVSRQPVPERDCPRCRHSVPANLRICPSCRVYLPLADKAAG